MPLWRKRPLSGWNDYEPDAIIDRRKKLGWREGHHRALPNDRPSSDAEVRCGQKPISLDGQRQAGAPSTPELEEPAHAVDHARAGGDRDDRADDGEQVGHQCGVVVEGDVELEQDQVRQF